MLQDEKRSHVTFKITDRLVILKGTYMLILYVCVWVKCIKFYTFYTQNSSIHRMCSHSAICFPDNILFKKEPRTLEAKSMSRAQQIPTQYSYPCSHLSNISPLPLLKKTFYAILVWVLWGFYVFKFLSASVYVCLCMYMSVDVYATRVQMPTKPRGSFLSPWAGVTGSCEQLTQFWDWTQVLWKSSKHP